MSMSAHIIAWSFGFGNNGKGRWYWRRLTLQGRRPRATPHTLTPAKSGCHSCLTKICLMKNRAGRWKGGRPRRAAAPQPHLTHRVVVEGGGVRPGSGLEGE